MINLYSGTFTPLHKNVTIVKPMFITFKKRVYEEGKEFMIGFGHGKRPEFWGWVGGGGGGGGGLHLLEYSSYREDNTPA